MVTLLVGVGAAAAGTGKTSTHHTAAPPQVSTTVTTAPETTTTPEPSTTTTAATPGTAPAPIAPVPTSTVASPRGPSPAATRGGAPVPRALLTEAWPPARDPRRVYVSAQGAATNGYVSRLILTWGDASVARTFNYPASSCQTPGGVPTDDAQVADDNHGYPASGTYTVRLVVTASSCDGTKSQTASTQMTVSYPSSPPSS